MARVVVRLRGGRESHRGMAIVCGDRAGFINPVRNSTGVVLRGGLPSPVISTEGRNPMGGTHSIALPKTERGTEPKPPPSRIAPTKPATE